MLSRVANCIYWMSRYIERAENIARFIDVDLHLALDLPDMAGQAQWNPVAATTGDHAYFTANYPGPTQENVIQFLTFDQNYASSVITCIRMARENARTIREIISSEMWEQVNRFYHFLKDEAKTRRAFDSPHEFFDQVKLHSHLFSGIMDATMSHNEGWHFARIGRLTERADKTSRILDVKYFLLLPQPDWVGTPLDNLQWAAVLKSASAFEMYRKKYRRINPRQVAEFLILDAAFPRAVHFCLVKAEESLHVITGTRKATFKNAAEQKLGRLRAEFDYMTIDEIFDRGLHEFLDGFQARLNKVGEAIFQTFFAAPPVSEAARPGGQTQSQKQ